MQADHQEKSRRLLIFDLFDQISNSGGTLIIGGDFFDFWFNYKNVMPSFYTDIIYELNKLNQNDVEIHFLAGNHDYWDFGLLSSLPVAYFMKVILSLFSTIRKSWLPMGMDYCHLIMDID